ncbi:hypothetical protein ACNO5E_25160 [Vibrio parahaemolyticus]|uniref:hypothetical protein n=1 Tax=Vibrio parahaemolyticus TaxID=670 RepID=UPI0008130E7B|nr:hypothetical protein [Vibrio parahaemolyticus]OCP68440.1 hypothetical protein AKH08_16655 [Vibrio parahaemolyticus]
MLVKLEAQINVAVSQITEVVDSFSSKHPTEHHTANVALHCLKALQNQFSEFKVNLEAQAKLSAQQSSELMEENNQLRIASEQFKIECQELSGQNENLRRAEEKAVKKFNVEIAKRQELESKYNKLQGDFSSLCRRFDAAEGKSVGRSFPGKSRDVELFVNEFQKPLPISFAGGQILASNWHFQVVKNNGVSIFALPSVWLTPILPLSEEFQAEWNPKISEYLTERMVEKAKVSHPEVYKRTLKAKNLPITNDDIFDTNESAALKKAKLITLYDAASTTEIAFNRIVLSANKKLSSEAVVCMYRKVKQLEAQFFEGSKISA